MARFSSLFLATAFAIQLSYNPAPTFAQSVPQSVSADAKGITDPAEYQAYIEALKTDNPFTIDQFVARYPQSSVLAEVLAHGIAPYLESRYDALGYWASGEDKVLEFAKRLREMEPNDIRTLAVITILDIKRVSVAKNGAIEEMCADSQTGLKQLSGWQAPEGMTRSESKKLRNNMSYTFNIAAGECAFLRKDITAARTFYRNAVQLFGTRLVAVWGLTLSDLQDPIDVQGLAYCDKTVQLLRVGDGNSRRSANYVAHYCQAVNRRVHTARDGQNRPVGQAAAKETVPSLSLALGGRAPH